MSFRSDAARLYERVENFLAEVAEARSEEARLRWLRRLLPLVFLLQVPFLVYGAVRVYRDAPPIPQEIRAGGRLLFTRAEVVAGKDTWQKRGLMDLGSFFGNGSYYGPDFTATFLRETLRTADSLRPSGAKILRRSARLARGRVELPAIWAEVTSRNRVWLAKLVQQGSPYLGLPPYLLRPEEVKPFAAFLTWSSLAELAPRPGSTESYTHNWPNDPHGWGGPGRATFFWTWFSLALFLGALGLIIYLYLFQVAPATTETARQIQPQIGVFRPELPGQRVALAFFAVAAIFLVAQILPGLLMAHYYIDRTGFAGVTLYDKLPFPLLRAWHLQLGLDWIILTWLGSGLFMAPLIAGREPPGQAGWNRILLALVTLAVLGSLIGIALQFQGVWESFRLLWFWVGNQGLEYLELGRAFQFLLLASLLFWAIILGRILRGAYGRPLRLARLFLLSGFGLMFFYGFGLIPLFRPEPNFTLQDFWRWWVVHLWVEQVFEFFEVTVTTFAFLLLGLVKERLAETVVYFELIFVTLSGTLGIGHHLYWAGEPVYWLAVGSSFSILEILPLVLLTVEAIRQEKIIERLEGAFPKKLAFHFFTAAAFWNFVGAGVIGGLLNTPLANYYAHGGFLTLAHSHLATFGGFGLLGLGLGYLALNEVGGRQDLGRLAYWLFNLSLALWLVFHFLPIGFQQFLQAYHGGYFSARSVRFYDSVRLFAYLRLPGDLAFATASLLVAYDYLRRLRQVKKEFPG